MSRFFRFTSTTVSREASGSSALATSGNWATMAAWPRSIELCTSVTEPCRVTTMLSGSPVLTSVLRRPASSMSTAAKT